MEDGAAVAAARLVDLDQGEGGAWHLFVGAAAAADEGPGEGGLARSQVSPQGDDVAGANDGGKFGGESRRCLFVGEVSDDIHGRNNSP